MTVCSSWSVKGSISLFVLAFLDHGLHVMGVLDWSRSLVGAFDKFGDSLRNRPDISGHSPALRSDFCGVGGIVCLFVIHCLLWAHFMYPLSNVI